MPSLTFGFGSMPVGSGPFGSALAAGAGLSVLTTLAIRENVVRVTFNEAPRYTQLGDPNDAASASRYAIVPVDGTTGRDGNPTRPVSVAAIEQANAGGTVLDLVLDRPMSPEPGVYDLTLTGLVTAAALLPMATTTVQYTALFKGLVPPIPEKIINNRDIANPQTLASIMQPLPVATGESLDGLLGTYQPDSQGDLAFEEGLIAYKKRVFRRLVTRRGAYAHLPNYGIGVLQTTKQLARAGIREQLAIEAEDQIRLEPETIDVSVAIVVDSNDLSLSRYRIRARTSFGPNIDFDVPITFTQTGF